jgi:hypothetical protein
MVIVLRLVVKPQHAVCPDVRGLRYIGVGYHVWLGFEIPWMVPLGHAAQRLMKYMKFAFDALPRPARKAHIDELTRLHGAHVGLCYQCSCASTGLTAGT